ncbi:MULTISPECIES: SRPBCC family protein [Acinetobacter]|uniref:SRPBCC family protein n=1 Tax=Acinetobacter TaxID=469 RepID=UPI002002D618|nr:SRPBCC family protein [Acinetobacter radioresistens]MCK4079222.1 SRPBCC family protein [Acinetobacter radioresistens]MCU4501069.1 SRPBCC family protein [Acinetobacter radioresistens]MCX0339133.1 SRPBCC family protein [Acinetobacter radioresistens]
MFYSNRYFYLIVWFWLSASTVVSAQIITWTEQIPSSLSPFQGNIQTLAGLTGDRIFIYAHPKQNIQLPTFQAQQKIQGKYYSGAVIVPTSSQNIAKLLTHYRNYAGLFPTLKSAKIQAQQGNITQVKYQIHIPTPIPVLNFKEQVLMQHQYSNNSIATLVIDAPVPYGAGKIEWFDIGNQRTLVTITQWGDLNQPKGFLFSKILNAIPEAKLGIPGATNAFLLEALQRRYKISTTQNLKAGTLPEFQLSTAQRQKIVKLSQQSQEPVSFILSGYQVPYQQGTEAMRFSTSYQYLAQNPEQLKPWLQPPSFKSLFPRQIKNVQSKQLNPQQLDADYQVSVGLGVISIPFDFKLRFDYPNSLQNVFHAVGGDLKYIQGGMQLDAYGQGTVLKLTSAVKIHDQAPFLLRTMRSLPYHDMLPAIGGNTILALKIKQRVK